MDKKILDEIEQIIYNHEKKREKLSLIGAILSILALIIGVWFMYTYFDKEVVIRVRELAPFSSIIIYRLSRIGSKHKNKEINKIKDLLKNNN